MKIYNTFESFIKEALKAGEDSEIYVDDYTLDSGETIKAAEILGAIKTSPTEKEFKQYFFDEYGEGSFASGELEKLTAFYNEVKGEEKEKEAEEEKEREELEKAKEGGDDGEPNLDLDI